MADVPAGIESALDYFVGYVMLDAWIANPDRHHENWAAIWDGSAMRLAPTFDHGAALARNLLDSEREERLTIKYSNRTVESFARKGRSAFLRFGRRSTAVGTARSVSGVRPGCPECRESVAGAAAIAEPRRYLWYR